MDLFYLKCYTKFYCIDICSDIRSQNEMEKMFHKPPKYLYPVAQWFFWGNILLGGFGLPLGQGVNLQIIKRARLWKLYEVTPWSGASYRQSGKWFMAPSFPEATQSLHTQWLMLCFPYCLRVFPSVGVCVGNRFSKTAEVLVLWCPFTALTHSHIKVHCRTFQLSSLLLSRQFSSCSLSLPKPVVFLFV